MNYQDQLLKELQENFPKYSLKDFSKALDIEKTRLFRLLNGVEMRVSELWKIEEFLKKRTSGEMVCSLGILGVSELKLQLERNSRLRELLDIKEVA